MIPPALLYPLIISLVLLVSAVVVFGAWMGMRGHTMDSRRAWLRVEADAVREEAEEERKWAAMMDQKPGVWETELKEKGIPLSLSVLQPSDSTFSPSTSSESSLFSSSSSAISATHLQATFLILLPTEGSDEESLGEMELGVESLALEVA